jgi:hypothetical protein
MATDRGVLGREDADMSNDKTGEIPVRRKPKVSRATIFVPGLVRTDGQRVNIPALPTLNPD